MHKIRNFAILIAVLSGLVGAAHAEGDSKRFRQYRPPPEPEALPAKVSPAKPGPGLFSLPTRKPTEASQKGLPPQLPNVCPESGGTESWTAWRDTAINYLLITREPTREERKAGQTVPYLYEQDVLRRSSQIVVALARCADIGRPPPADGPEDPLRNLKNFVRMQHTANFQLPNPQHQFGHGPALTDDDHLCQARPALELPCLLKSREFLDAIGNQATYSKALDLIKQRNDGTLDGECSEPKPDSKVKWDTLIYRSRFLTAPDKGGGYPETLGRFLVVVPGQGPQPDRWIQFGIWTPQDSCYWRKDCPHINNVSIAAVAKVGGIEPSAVTPLLPYDAIADWWRCVGDSCTVSRVDDGAILARDACNVVKSPDDDKTVQLRFRLQVNGETDNCQRCHKMMPNGIHPEQVYRFDERHKEWLHPVEKSAVEKAANLVNDRIRNWESWYARAPIFSTGKDDTTPHWENYGAWGFGTGPQQFGIKASRSDRWMQACSARGGVKLNFESRNKVQGSMGCAWCHNGGIGEKSYGALNFPLGTDKRRGILFAPEPALAPNIIRSHILRGVMPLKLVANSDPPTMTPKGGLSLSEREALFECLSLEYFDPEGPAGLFVDWLKNEDKDREQVPTTIRVITGQQPQPEGSARVLALAPKPAAQATPNTPSADFSAYCADCHAANGAATAWGPSLRGVASAPIASTSFRDYSRDLRELGRQQPGQPQPVWDEAKLLEFLKDPDAFLGNGRQPTMMHWEHWVRDEEARRRIFNYLTTLK